MNPQASEVTYGACSHRADRSGWSAAPNATTWVRLARGNRGFGARFFLHTSPAKEDGPRTDQIVFGPLAGKFAGNLRSSAPASGVFYRIPKKVSRSGVKTFSPGSKSGQFGGTGTFGRS